MFPSIMGKTLVTLANPTGTRCQRLPPDTASKQLLLDEVEHDSEKSKVDNTNRGLDNFAVMRKLNPIFVL